MSITRDANTYFTDGCGRCELGGTPQCKVHQWAAPLARMRQILLDCGLHEEAKWGHPCYTFQGQNVILLGSFNEYCVLSFLKGALLSDPMGILEKPGENTNEGRVLRVTDVQQVQQLEETLKTYLFEAIEIERAGLKVPSKPISEYTLPEELQQKFEALPDFHAAFRALTHGRQRGYLIHFSQPKQAATRTARIEKCMERIFRGVGLNE
jgi:uncharacterized protein YdeI (YjbR/CyaY-like superfamily)